MAIAPRVPPPPVHLVAMGTATCLGGHVAAAAAFRASLTRFRPLAEFVVVDDETNEMVPLIAAGAVEMTAGFEGDGRIIRLAVEAIEDMTTSTSVAIDWRRAALCVAVTVPPQPSEEEDDEEEDDDDNEPTPRRRPSSTHDWAAEIADAVVEHTGLAADRARCHLYTDERAGAVLALREATDALARGDLDDVLLVAVDSLVDEVKLARLAQDHRLKTASRAVGLIPGEAGTALWLSRRARALNRSADVLLHCPVVAPGTQPSDHVADGRTLKAVMTAAAALTTKAVGTIYSDLNGEELRAVDFGAALVQCGTGSAFHTCRQIFPATAFGETGAASPVLAISLAAQAFARGYAGDGAAVLLVTGDDGMRAAIAIERGA